METLINTLETEIALATKHLEEDLARKTDPINGRFFEGRSVIERQNLEMLKRLMDLANRIAK